MAAALMALAAAAFTAPTRPVRSSPMQHIVMRKKESWARRLPAGMPLSVIILRLSCFYSCL